MSQDKNIAIIGSGIIGLTCAEILVSNNVIPTIFSDKTINQTASYKASALWEPYKVEDSVKAIDWALRTYDILQSKIKNNEKGFFETTFFEYFDEKPDHEDWHKHIDTFVLHKKSLKTKGFPYAFEGKVPFMNAPVILTRMVESLTESGVRFNYTHVNGLNDEALKEFGVVINCTGVGASSFSEDKALNAVRGQTIVVSNPGIKKSTIYCKSDNEICYIFPRGKDCVIGGSYELTNLSPKEDKNLTKDILNRAYFFEPSLEGQPILRVNVGFRPTRPSIRLEKEVVADKLVIHNYGHGGAGWSLAWGCAETVLSLLK